MRYTTATFIAIAGFGNAVPRPQLSIPGGGGGGSIPSIPGAGGGSTPSIPGAGAGGTPSVPGIGGGLGSGGGAGIPGGTTGIPSIGGGSGGLGGLAGGLTGGGAGGSDSGSGVDTSAAVEVPAATTPPTEDAPAPESGSGQGTVGASCSPQAGNGGGTENGITDGNCCTDMTVIFARGTSETGNMGTIAGPPMASAIREKLGADRVTVQGVDYPASAGGNADMGASGGPEMAELVQTALSQCPDTQIILSGYSQGGMVVHNAMSSGVSSGDVAGAVLFGDPFNGQAVGDLDESQVKQFCGTSDTLCGSGGEVSGGHLSYGSAADEAADFAISAAGLA